MIINTDQLTIWLLQKECIYKDVNECNSSELWCMTYHRTWSSMSTTMRYNNGTNPYKHKPMLGDTWWVVLIWQPGFQRDRLTIAVRSWFCDCWIVGVAQTNPNCKLGPNIWQETLVVGGWSAKRRLVTWITASCPPTVSGKVSSPKAVTNPSTRSNTLQTKNLKKWK